MGKNKYKVVSETTKAIYGTCVPVYIQQIRDKLPFSLSVYIPRMCLNNLLYIIKMVRYLGEEIFSSCKKRTAGIILALLKWSNSESVWPIISAKDRRGSSDATVVKPLTLVPGLLSKMTSQDIFANVTSWKISVRQTGLSVCRGRKLEEWLMALWWHPSHHSSTWKWSLIELDMMII